MKGGPGRTGDVEDVFSDYHPWALENLAAQARVRKSWGRNSCVYTMSDVYATQTLLGTPGLSTILVGRARMARLDAIELIRRSFNG